MPRINLPLRKAFGERLKELRGDAPLIQFCAHLGFHPSKWNRYETGSEAPSFETLAKICDKTGARPDWLLLGISAQRLPASKGRYAEKIREAHADYSDPHKRQLVIELKDLLEVAEDYVIEALLQNVRAFRRSIGEKKKNTE